MRKPIPRFDAFSSQLVPPLPDWHVDRALQIKHNKRLKVLVCFTLNPSRSTLHQSRPYALARISPANVT